MTLRINLGGEGEEPGVLNQQGRWVVLRSSWYSSRGGETFAELLRQGLDFVIADNQTLPFPDDTFDVVYTNAIPLDTVTILGPSILTVEVERILKPGGIWIHDGNLQWAKP